MSPELPSVQSEPVSDTIGISLMVLGTVQDAGLPHIGCRKACCRDFFRTGRSKHMVVSLGLIDHGNRKKFLLEATPDMSAQIKDLKESGFASEQETPDGIFLTHAHIGHYAGLMYLGKEALGAKGVPVYAMPRMKKFLETNGPWSQLVSDENIALQEIAAEDTVSLTPQIQMIPLLVPHRDEFSETVGYKILGPNKSVLFIPDINKWDLWERDIVQEIRDVDYAFIDATFYDAAEINHRDISEIPHPFVVESMAIFDDLPAREKQKIQFIHLNHTNPLHNEESVQYQEVLKQGYGVAKQGAIYGL